MKIGDWLTFKAQTRFCYRKARRVIVGFDSLNRPLVRYEGWPNFIVKHSEIIKWEKRT